jgi:hypothetical protein
MAGGGGGFWRDLWGGLACWLIMSDEGGDGSDEGDGGDEGGEGGDLSAFGALLYGLTEDSGVASFPVKGTVAGSRSAF